MNDVSSSHVEAPQDITKVLGVGKKRVPLWRRWWVLTIVALVAALVGYLTLAPAKPVSYIMGKVEVGDLKSIVTATGTLQPIDKVTVGAEVSGRIDEVLVEYRSC